MNEDGTYVVFVYYIQTDNCPTQYKCHHNFMFVASVVADVLNEMFPGRKIRVEHVFAEKFRFKGYWDREGKVTKALVGNGELKSERSIDSLSVYLNAIKNSRKLVCKNEQRDDGDKEYDANIVQNHPNTVDLRKFYYVTADHRKREDAVDAGVDNDDIIIVNRVKVMKASKSVVGTTGFKHVRSTSAAPRVIDGVKEYKLTSSNIPCGCDLCLRGGFANCAYLQERGGKPKDHFLKKG